MVRHVAFCVATVFLMHILLNFKRNYFKNPKSCRLWCPYSCSLANKLGLPWEEGGVRGLLPPSGSGCGAPDAQPSEPCLAPWRAGLWCLVLLVCRAQSGMWRNWEAMGPEPSCRSETLLGLGEPRGTDWPFCWML